MQNYGDFDDAKQKVLCWTQMIWNSYLLSNQPLVHLHWKQVHSPILEFQRCQSTTNQVSPFTEWLLVLLAQKSLRTLLCWADEQGTLSFQFALKTPALLSEWSQQPNTASSSDHFSESLLSNLSISLSNVYLLLEIPLIPMVNISGISISWYLQGFFPHCFTSCLILHTQEMQ